MRLIVWSVSVILLTSCGDLTSEQPISAEVESKSDFDRQLVDQHYNAVLWFARSAEMKVLFEQAYEHASIKLQQNLLSIESTS